MAINSTIAPKVTNANLSFTTRKVSKDVFQAQSTINNISSYLKNRIEKRKLLYENRKLRKRIDQYNKDRNDRESQLEAKRAANENYSISRPVLSTGDGFFKRLLSGLGWIIAGAMLKYLPPIIGYAQEFIARITELQSIGKSFFDNIFGIFNSSFGVLSSMKDNLMSFDFIDSSGKVRENIQEINKNFDDMGNNFERFIDVFTKDLTKEINGVKFGTYSNQEIPGVGGSQAGDETGSAGGMYGAYAPSGIQKEIYEYLVNEKGLNDVQAIGLMANISRESSFNPAAREKGGTGHGLFQWSFERATAMKKAVPGWETNWKGQIDYALSEPTYLSQVPPGAYKAKKFKSAQEAAQWWMEEWERPRNTIAGAKKHAEYIARLPKAPDGSARFRSPSEGGSMNGSSKVESDIMDFRKFRTQYGASGSRVASYDSGQLYIREMGIYGSGGYKINPLADDTNYEIHKHKGAGHWDNRAWDIPVPNKEVGNKVAAFWRSRGYKVIWNSPDHYNHVHVEVPESKAQNWFAGGSSQSGPKEYPAIKNGKEGYLVTQPNGERKWIQRSWSPEERERSKRKNSAVSSISAQSSIKPMGSGNAIFGETGNVSNRDKNWVHGHFQTTEGTANDLVNDVAPLVRELINSGATPELSQGQKFTKGMSDDQIKKLIRTGISQHRHSGDGRSVDIFIPKGTKVPFPLYDVREARKGAREGITGILPGTGKVWVGHLDPRSKSGGSMSPSQSTNTDSISSSGPKIDSSQGMKSPKKSNDIFVTVPQEDEMSRPEISGGGYNLSGQGSVNYLLNRFMKQRLLTDLSYV